MVDLLAIFSANFATSEGNSSFETTLFIKPIISFLSLIGLNFFGEDPVSAGFGLFNAGGIIFMIIGKIELISIFLIFKKILFKD